MVFRLGAMTAIDLNQISTPNLNYNIISNVNNSFLQPYITGSVFLPAIQETIRGTRMKPKAKINDVRISSDHPIRLVFHSHAVWPLWPARRPPLGHYYCPRPYCPCKTLLGSWRARRRRHWGQTARDRTTGGPRRGASPRPGLPPAAPPAGPSAPPYALQGRGGVIAL